MSFSLVEPCCGSFALTAHMLGATRAILPYQGSKWRFRYALEAILCNEFGFIGKPKTVSLADTGPWGRVAAALLIPVHRTAVVGILRKYAEADPKEMYLSLHGQSCDLLTLTTFTAQFLFLQRLAFSGKAVGTPDGRWASPGFNETSAYGVKATDKFGAVKPMIPSLIRVLESYDKTVRTDDVSVWARRGNALESVGRGSFAEDEKVAVYIDPPYAGTTAYPDKLSRGDLVMVALSWRKRGARVIVSEAEPIQELVALGWKTKQLWAGRGDTSPFRGKQEEWVTFL